MALRVPKLRAPNPDDKSQVDRWRQKVDEQLYEVVNAVGVAAAGAGGAITVTTPNLVDTYFPYANATKSTVSPFGHTALFYAIKSTISETYLPSTSTTPVDDFATLTTDALAAAAYVSDTDGVERSTGGIINTPVNGGVLHTFLDPTAPFYSGVKQRVKTMSVGGGGGGGGGASSDSYGTWPVQDCGGGGGNGGGGEVVITDTVLSAGVSKTMTQIGSGGSGAPGNGQPDGPNRPAAEGLTGANGTETISGFGTASGGQGGGGGQIVSRDVNGNLGPTGAGVGGNGGGATPNPSSYGGSGRNVDGSAGLIPFGLGISALPEIPDVATGYPPYSYGWGAGALAQTHGVANTGAGGVGGYENNRAYTMLNGDPGNPGSGGRVEVWHPHPPLLTVSRTPVDSYSALVLTATLNAENLVSTAVRQKNVNLTGYTTIKITIVPSEARNFLRIRLHNASDDSYIDYTPIFVGINSQTFTWDISGLKDHQKSSIDKIYMEMTCDSGNPTNSFSAHIYNWYATGTSAGGTLLNDYTDTFSNNPSGVTLDSSIMVTGSVGSTVLGLDKAVYSDTYKNLRASTTSKTELGYLTGVTSSVQDQLNTLTAAQPTTMASVATKWLKSYDSTTHSFTQTQPTQADISGLEATASPTFAGLALGTGNLTMTGSLGATGARLTKGWFTDLECTNAIAASITGNASTVTGLAVTAGQTLTVTTGGTIGSAAYTASTDYDAAGVAASAVSAHAALITGVHGLVFTAGQSLTMSTSTTLGGGNHSGTNTGDNADNSQYTKTSVYGALGSGVLYNTTTTGVPSIAVKATAIDALASAAGWLHNDGAGAFAYSTPTKADVGLGNVENTALSTWAGTTNITTLGTIGTGTWNATAIADGKIASALTGKTYNALTLTSAAVGFTIAGGTTSKTLTVPLDASVSGTNSGDNAANSTYTIGSQTMGYVAPGISGNVLTSNGTVWTSAAGGAGTGTVTSVSVTTANGISGTVENATTTPAISLSLGAITPTTVNGLTLSSPANVSNTSIGLNAMPITVSGLRNTAIATGALGSITSGNENTAIGYSSLNYITTGHGNTAVGYNCLNGVSLGNPASYNVGIGYYAGAYETGSNAFYLDNQNRTNTAGDKAGALLYGTFNATPASQTLKCNGTFSATAFGTINGNTISTGTGTLSLGAGSTLATSTTNSITLTSTAATNVTLPTTGTLAILGSNTFTGAQQINSSLGVTGVSSFGSGAGAGYTTNIGEGTGHAATGYYASGVLKAVHGLEITGGQLVAGAVSGDYSFRTVGGSILFSAHSGGDLGMKLDSTGVVTIPGNVGIGTTTPSAKLSINGGLHVGGDSDPGDNNAVIDGTLGVTVASSFGTLAVGGGATWDVLGALTTAAVIADTTRYLNVTVGGVAYKLIVGT